MLKNNLLVLAILFAGTFCNCAFAQEQKKASSDKEGKITYEMLVNQYNFPVKKNTNDPEKDQKAYVAAKRKWVEANRELYRRYNEQGIKANPESRRTAQPSFSQTK
jgi:hypothetical protein